METLDQAASHLKEITADDDTKVGLLDEIESLV